MEYPMELGISYPTLDVLSGVNLIVMMPAFLTNGSGTPSFTHIRSRRREICSCDTDAWRSWPATIDS